MTDDFRPDVYLCLSEQNDHLLGTGITFAEFVGAVGDLNLLMLSEPPDCEVWHRRTNFHYVPSWRVSDLLREDIYSLGDFQWVDFAEADDLDDLTPQEIARLLYLGHKWEPLDSPFVDRLKSRFAYLAHDDGWLLKLYCREPDGFASLLARMVPAKLSGATGKRVSSLLPQSISTELLDLSKQGLLMSFGQSARTGTIEVRCIGRHDDMDFVLNSLRSLREKVAQPRLLTLAGSSWTLSG